MRTDELRNELHDLAAELEGFEGDARRVRGGVQRRRVAIAGALVVALAIPAVTFALRDRPDSISVTGPKEVAVEELTARDALVIVEDGERIANVRVALESSELVAAFSELPAGVASLLQPLELWMSLDACDEGGFVIDLRGGPEDAERLAGTLPSEVAVYDWRDVTAEALGRWNDGVDIEIFMTVDATRAQVDAVASTLERMSEVDAIEQLSKQDAFAEFRRIFADQPDLLQTTTAENLPESFRVVLRGDSSAEEVAARFEIVAGVDEVLTPALGVGGNRREYVEEVLSSLAPARTFGVTLNPAATDEEIEAIRLAIEDDRAVEAVRVVTPEDFVPEGVAPELLSSLPVSLEVTAAEGVRVSELSDRIAAIPGVVVASGGTLPCRATAP
jgi:FtsX extracellular domain